MSAQNPPVNGVAYTVYIALQDMATPGAYKANPTLAAGDVKVSIDGGAFNNLTTLPTVTPAAGIAVKVALSASEMTGDNIFVQFIDQTSPKEWADYAFTIQTVAGAWNVGKTGYALSAAGVQAIWDALTSALTTVGSIGKRLADDIDATISSRLASASYTAAPTATENADALLKRDWTAVTGEAARSLLNAGRKLMNKVGISGGTLTVYKEDDATAAYTQTITQDASQAPIQSLDTN